MRAPKYALLPMSHPRMLAVIALALASSCSEAKPGPAQTPIPPEILAKLAAADAKDGAVDKVVHRCAGCSLNMDGSAEHAIRVEDYTLHLCSTDCLARYQKDAVKELGGLKIRD